MNLTEASRLIESLDEEYASENEELQKFSDDVQNAGIEILSCMDKQYFVDLADYVQATLLSSASEHGSVSGQIIKDLLWADKDLMLTMSIDILRVCVGLCALEEIR